MILRSYEASDINEVVSLFYNTVHTINLRDYSQEQVDAWAPKQLDINVWNKSLLENYSLVAIENKQMIGFGDIDKTGYLNRLYVHKDHQGKCIASKICNQLEAQNATDKIKVNASITAQPFFEKRGYKVLKIQQVKRNGICLKNYVMEKCLRAEV